MGWRKQHRQQYFYRKVRQEGRVKSLYLGRGPAAHLAAEEIAEAKERRLAQREALRSLQELLEPMRGQLREFAGQVRLMVAAQFLLNGFYQHHRSEWRKRNANPRSAA
jgi:hypothetical protein